KAIDSEGNEITPLGGANVVPSVSYIQPADQADLDKVIQEARLKSGRLPTKAVFNKREGSWLSILIWFNVGFLAMILLFLGYRKFVSRS
ncbi:MAG: hypothetical protein ABIK07_07770, partial [Planctomycetota bacterium]